MTDIRINSRSSMLVRTAVIISLAFFAWGVVLVVVALLAWWLA